MLAYLSKMAVRFVRFVRRFSSADNTTAINCLNTKALRVQAIFAGMDLAEALGYAKPQNALLTHVDKEDKSTAPIQGTAYETRVTIINESGLYALILSSKIPQART